MSANKENENVFWFVSDIADLPIKDHSINFLLNIFSPANYQEFERVTTKGGYLIKVIPNEGHFRELRECIGIENELDQNQKVKDLMHKNTIVIEQHRLMYQFDVKDLNKELLAMSPISFGIEKFSDLKISKITIDVEVIVAKFSDEINLLNCL